MFSQEENRCGLLKANLFVVPDVCYLCCSWFWVTWVSFMLKFICSFEKCILQTLAPSPFSPVQMWKMLNPSVPAYLVRSEL